MAYITSRPELPASDREMKKAVWYNMWRTRRWPYGELLRGDLLYWYESSSRLILWKTHVRRMERFRYQTKEGAARRIEQELGPVDRTERYYRRRPEKGYCLAIKIGRVTKVRFPKPTVAGFSRLGWQRVDESVAKQWLRAW